NCSKSIEETAVNAPKNVFPHRSLLINMKGCTKVLSCKGKSVDKTGMKDMSYQKSHQNKVYVYPQLHGVDLVFLRIGGVGLGNLLFPFARAVIFAKRYGFRLIAPTWF